jgi:hypothetical protein
MSTGPLETLYEALAIPAGARLDQRVAKSLLAGRGELSAADKRHVEAGLERLIWRATLRPQNVGVAAFKDDQHDYAQIVVMSAALRPDAKAARLTETIHRAIAHPLVLLSESDAGAVLSVGIKRRHEREADRVIVERLTESLPVNPAQDETVSRFLTSLPLVAVSAHDLLSLHLGWEARIEAFAAARITSSFRLPRDAVEATLRRQALASYDLQTRKARALRKVALSERRLNRRLELARDAARAEADLTKLAELLR